MNPTSEDLLHVLGYLYLRCGQHRRALCLMKLADMVAPAEGGIGKTLAYAYLANGAAQEALDTIARLGSEDPPDPMASLLKSRAMLQLGDVSAARIQFQRYVEQRERNQNATDDSKESERSRVVS